MDVSEMRDQLEWLEDQVKNNGPMEEMVDNLNWCGMESEAAELSYIMKACQDKIRELDEAVYEANKREEEAERREYFEGLGLWQTRTA